VNSSIAGTASSIPNWPWLRPRRFGTRFVAVAVLTPL
jgi:hypothetical protein